MHGLPACFELEDAGLPVQPGVEIDRVVDGDDAVDARQAGAAVEERLRG